MKIGDVVKLKESRFQDKFPAGSICVVWDIDTRAGSYFPLGLILMSDESEEPNVGWFKEQIVELVEEV